MSINCKKLAALLGACVVCFQSLDAQAASEVSQVASDSSKVTQTTEMASTETAIPVSDWKSLMGDGYTSSFFLQFKFGGGYTFGQQSSFVSLLSPDLDLALGYNITPFWSVRLAGGFTFGRASTPVGLYTYKYFELYGDGLFNILNAVKYKPSRRTKLFVYAGIGPAITVAETSDTPLHSYMNARWDGGKAFFTGRAGLFLDVTLIKNLDLVAEAGFTCTDDQLDCKTGNGPTTRFAAKLGFQYNIHPFTAKYEAMLKARNAARNAGSDAAAAPILVPLPLTEETTPAVSDFAPYAKDNIVKYKMKVVDRKIEIVETYNIVFRRAKYALVPSLSSNATEIARIKQRLNELVSGKYYMLDSVLVVGHTSPEGTVAYNNGLSANRARTIMDYFDAYMHEKVDSINSAHQGVDRVKPVCYRSHGASENWVGLDTLIAADTNLTAKHKRQYAECLKELDLDKRDSLMSKYSWYPYVAYKIYPKLRSVDFKFILKSKGVEKDTVQTNVIDSVYMDGVKALKEKDYKTALSKLKPYNDFNTAVALLATDKNSKALEILKGCEQTAEVHYLQAIAYSRLKDDEQAVRHFSKAYNMDKNYITRANSDPDIARLVKEHKVSFDAEP